MSKHLERDIDNIHMQLMKLFGVVEGMIDKAVRALTEKKVELAKDVINTDAVVNAAEVGIEEECLKILALHQPVATDLRRVTTVLKINVDLERMADLSCNIAERAESMHLYPWFPIPDQMTEMADQATRMIRLALDSFVEMDAELARQVILLDEQVDENNFQTIKALLSLMKSDSSIIESALHCFSASRHLERVADLAENIAEDVIYLVEGEIVRHLHGNFANQRK